MRRLEINMFKLLITTFDIKEKQIFTVSLKEVVQIMIGTFDPERIFKVIL